MPTVFVRFVLALAVATPLAVGVSVSKSAPALDPSPYVLANGETKAV